MIRFWVLNITAGTLFIAGWAHGVIADVFLMDRTRMTFFIAATGTIGLYNVARKRWEAAAYYGQLCARLGIMGTIIGFLWALAGLAEADNEAMLAGVKVALLTTLVGLGARIWIRDNIHRLR